ncbi:Atg6/Beclin [Trema orientale]|uniref:Atg6/Beclin n=1 Tax=Trema orientale TaxID=63057 RepID=A0A2P5FJS2_TREOI|nr:Atg6/Beclin [Trema orientale]
MSEKSRSFPVDPNLPRWACQNCRQPLCIVGVDPYAEKFFNDSSSTSRSAMQGSSVHGASSVLASTRMDHSFVVLPPRPQAQGAPPRPRGGAVPSDIGQPGKAMDESFVVVYKSESSSDAGGNHVPVPDGGTNGSLQPNNFGFNSTITVLKRAFEIATTQTQVEQPLCLDCMRVLSDKLDKEVEDVNRDIEAYMACLKRLEGEPRDVLIEADFLKEKLKIEEEARKLEAAIEETGKQNADVSAELEELELKSSRFKELEERYWHEFNNFQYQLMSHQEERDAILAKIEVSQAHLDLLKKTNVLNDSFPIGHDGEFGTINNFRLGRLPKIPVRKLSTMLLYESFGPVNLFWSTRYDKAMTTYLTYLKEFAEFAYLKDQENNIPPEKCFKLPYNVSHGNFQLGIVLSGKKDLFGHSNRQIDVDKVESYSITQSFNKQENWTKALKYTLCNLKWALYWFVGNTNFQPLSAMVSSHAEVPAVGSLYAKRGTDSKSAFRSSPNM